MRDFVIGCFLLLNYISLVTCSSCVQYYTDSQTLQCSSAHSPCSYLLPYDNTSLHTTETRLQALFNRMKEEVKNGSLTENCSEALTLLYCHQVYVPCQMVESQGQVPLDVPLCEEDCMSVRTDCEPFWALLTHLVDTVVPGLPPVLSNCTTDGGADVCIPLLPSNVSDPQDCPSTSDSNDRTILIITICLGAGIPIALLAILCIIMVLCCCNTIKKDQTEDTDEAPAKLEQTQLGYTNQLPQNYNRSTLLMRPGNIRDAFLGLDSTAPSGTFARKLKTKEYMKMTPKQRLQALEFPHSNICIIKDRGENSFGPIYIGEATGLHENEPTTTVYIKSLRNDASGSLRQKFTVEMTWASGYNHPNVLSLLGVCNKEEPYYMIFENLEFGTLKHFLHTLETAWMDFDEFLNEEASTCASSTTPALGVDDLISMGIQVADGMDYLCSKGLVHKDLAARNCHVGQRLTVKIANFGLSYLPHSKEYCIVSSLSATTPVPLRWLAPESLQHGKFSIYSDVWSFGVLLWEIFTFGLHPFSDCSNAQVVKNIMHRNLLDVPESCPDAVNNLIHRCWHKTPVKRPLFSAISRELGNALGGLDGMDLKKFGKIPSTPDL